MISHNLTISLALTCELFQTDFCFWLLSSTPSNTTSQRKSLIFVLGWKSFLWKQWRSKGGHGSRTALSGGR